MEQKKACGMGKEICQARQMIMKIWMGHSHILKLKTLLGKDGVFEHIEN